MTTVADLMDVLQRWAPLELAAPWDNVGLLLGDRSAPAERVMTCLTVTPESVAEAVREGAQLIVSHHPILFRAVQKLTTATPEGRMLLELARARIAVYSPHTALDNAPGGINDGLARRLGLSEVQPLRALAVGRQVKLIAFVPEKDLAQVSDAIFAAGAGVIGRYRECSFRVTGTGTFFGEEGANPTVGQKGRREEASEWRLETICPESRAEAVVRALRQAHSYEEPAFDLVPLQADPSKNGQGRIGVLPRPVAVADFADQVRSALGARAVQTVGARKRPIRRVALACGAAGEFLRDAVSLKADIFLTGEMRFHDALAAQADDIALAIPGHYATERPGVEDLAGRLAEHFPDLTTWASRDEQDPLT